MARVMGEIGVSTVVALAVPVNSALVIRFTIEVREVICACPRLSAPVPDWVSLLGNPGFGAQLADIRRAAFSDARFGFGTLPVEFRT